MNMQLNNKLNTNKISNNFHQIKNKLNNNFVNKNNKKIKKCNNKEKRNKNNKRKKKKNKSNKMIWTLISQMINNQRKKRKKKINQNPKKKTLKNKSKRKKRLFKMILILYDVFIQTNQNIKVFNINRVMSVAYHHNHENMIGIFHYQMSYFVLYSEFVLGYKDFRCDTLQDQ